MASHTKAVAERLEQVRKDDKKTPLQKRELSELRLILFSDLHKGRRMHKGEVDESDDFRPCELVYLAALDYYWQEGFELFLLGDIEELWEDFPQPVIQAYEEVLNREKRFAEARRPTRYARFVGNHDDMWYDLKKVQEHLGSYLVGANVLEALRLEVCDQGQRLGELFLVHGHQGSLDADRLAKVSQWLVRHIVRPIQRIVPNFPSSTPSNNYKLRQKHEKAMYAYAKSQRGLVLIAGHTHRPVWIGMDLPDAIMNLVATDAEGFRGDQPTNLEEAFAIYPEAMRAHADQAMPVDMAWIQEQASEAVKLDGDKPCYFNTGCCSYKKHAVITGIEIADGEIRLVMWQHPASPQRTLIFPAVQLRDVLARVARTTPQPS
jgi:UDP-2,3-diacylglucosamine pyrophosphatase LpxH